MKLHDSVKMLASITEQAEITLKAKTVIRCHAADGMAGKLLLWLHEHLPDDATIGDADEILDAAKWWLTFYSATAKLSEPREKRARKEAG